MAPPSPSFPIAISPLWTPVVESGSRDAQPPFLCLSRSLLSVTSHEETLLEASKELEEVVAALQDLRKEVSSLQTGLGVFQGAGLSEEGVAAHPEPNDCWPSCKVHQCCPWPPMF